jgi:hypothetical protein
VGVLEHPEILPAASMPSNAPLNRFDLMFLLFMTTRS